MPSNSRPSVADSSPPADSLQPVLDDLDLIAWEADPGNWQGNVVSERLRAILGYPPDGWRTAGFWKRIMYPGDVERVASELRRGIESCRPFQVEYRLLSAAGKTFWFRDFVRPLSDGSGKVARLRGVMQDVTAEKRAIEALKESEERYRVLAENATDMIARCNAEDRFVYVSPACRALLGYEPEELVGRSCAELIHPEDHDLVRRVREGASDVYTIQFRVRRKDGAMAWFESTGRTVRDPATGKVVEHQSVTRDVTERKRLEADLFRSQKMEAIGRLAGGVAHDFNNLLTVIAGYTELAIKSLPPDDPIRRDLQEARKAGERAAALTRQLLAFGRSQARQTREVDLNRAVIEMERMLRRLIGEDIELSTVLAPGLGEVIADPGQVEQVIMNLVVNARDAMPKGGRVSIETARVDLDEVYARQHVGVKPGPYVMLAVSDTGRGMDAETLAHLFEPFFTTKGMGEGTGLGLSTVYGIVRQSAGHIWVYSEIGRGTTFRVYLPRVGKGKKAAPRAARRPKGTRGTETLLLVEDDAMVRSLASELLGRFGYSVLEAKGPHEAIRASTRHAGTIHLLLTDVVMPRMGGAELAARITSGRPDTRVLYMSGYTESALSQQGVLRPDAILLQKPFTADALARKVREAIEGTR